MELPGGVLVDGELRRSFTFKPLNGEIELALANTGTARAGTATRITAALAASLADVGGRAPTWDQLHAMSVGDRQFLVRALSVHLGMDRIWLTARCRSCETVFDFSVRQSELPVKPAGREYPVVTVRSGDREYRVRVPTGEDQEAVSELDDDEAMRVLVRRLIVGDENDVVEAPDIVGDVVSAIEEELDRAAPEVSTVAQTTCPDCGTSNSIAVDPYLCLDLAGTSILNEVHQLASAYHWSEHDILRLPRARRRHYLSLLDRARGMRS